MQVELVTHSIRREREARERRRSLIVAEYRARIHPRDIAKRYGCSEGTVRKYVRQDGAQRQGVRRGDVRAQIAAAYEAGDQIAEITRRFGCNRMTVWVIAREFGLPLRSPAAVVNKERAVAGLP